MSTKQIVVTLGCGDQYTEGVTYPDHLAALPQTRRVKSRVEDYLHNNGLHASLKDFNVAQMDAKQACELPTIAWKYAGIDLGSNSHTGDKAKQPLSEALKAQSKMIIVDEAKPPSIAAGDAATALQAAMQALVDSTQPKAPELDVETVRQLVADEVAKLTPRRVVHEFPTVTIEQKNGEIQHPQFETLAALVAGGCNRILIIGEAGMGKTHASRQIAESLNWPVFIQPPVSDSFQLIGYRDAEGNYQDTPTYRWAKHEGPAVLDLDELDVSQPNALMAISGLLGNGHAVFPHETLPIGPEKVVIATANTTGEGASMRYAGRLAQDGAILDRFAVKLHWTLCEKTERAIANAKVPRATTEKAVDASQLVRTNLNEAGIEMHWGPRRTYATAQAMSCGIKTRDALKLAGLQSLEDASQRSALKGVK